MVRTKKQTKPAPEAASEQPQTTEAAAAAAPEEEEEAATSLVESTTGEEAPAPAAVNGEAAVEEEPVSETAAAADTTTGETATEAAAGTKPGKKKKGKKEKSAAAAGQENGEGGGGGEGEGEKKEEKKKVKKSIPTWATLSEEAKKKLAHSKAVKVARPRLDEEVVQAIRACADSRGNASAPAIRNYLASNHPDLAKHIYKMALKKALNRQLIKQTKGTGLSGWFRVAPAPGSSSAPTNKKKAAAGGKNKAAANKGSIEDVLPLVFTWVCNPKEASFGYIRKYIMANYPDLDVEGLAFRKAVESGEAKGQLKRISGKGASGTFALVDGSRKTGAKYEDAIESAIIAMNEPKDASVTALRDYLGAFHKEFNTDQRPRVLKKALERCEAKGWIVRITGKGFSGTFRLNYPYYPSPRELWGAEYNERAEEKPKSTKKRKAASSESDDSEQEEEDDLSSDEEEVMPTPKKRGAPKPRASAAPPAARQKKAAAASKKTTALSKKNAAVAVIAIKSKPAAAAAAKKKAKSRKK